MTHTLANPIATALARAQLERLNNTPAAQELYAKSFGDYITDACPAFPWTRHTTRLVSIGQRVIDGDLPPRLMIELPPRHFKTTIFTRLLSGWFLRRFPDRTWGQGANTQALAEEFGEAARDYYVASGGVLSPSSQGKGRWKTAQGIGGWWGAGVGKGTGLPAHVINVDDPIKNREQAESAAYRRQLHSWWSNVLNTRVEPGAIKIITHTRWVDADLIGWLLKTVEELEREGNGDAAEPWHVISLPIIAEPIIKPLPALVTREIDDRQPGEALDPTRYDEKWARIQRLNTPERDWAALYQQRPQPDGGTVFNAGMFRFYGTRERPGLKGDAVLPDRFVRKLASLDCSFKDSPGADMVAMQLWGQDSAGAWLLNLTNTRLDFAATTDQIATLWPTWGFGELLVEDKANGSAVISTLQRAAAGFIVHAIDPVGGKTARANAATPEFNQGRVFFPRHHPLTPLLTSQLLKFPGDTYDDQVDALSQAINFMQGTGPMRVSTVHYGHGARADPPAPARRRNAVDFR
jgi:predicted phage terminase large subunit-like protein